MVDDAARSPARDRLVLALDTESLEQARQLARSLQPWFKTVKVGLQLFSAVGPEAVRRLREDGFEVFVDLKLYDIPQTVRRAAAAIAGLGAAYVTVHATGGAAMLEAATEGLEEGAEKRSSGPSTIGLAVTALTSEVPPASLVAERTGYAKKAGFGGVVCAVGDLATVHARAPGMLTVVPGIRFQPVEGDDQRRTGTPQEAVAAGADLLVVGRPVTGAADPVAASRQVAEAVEQVG